MVTGTAAIQPPPQDNSAQGITPPRWAGAPARLARMDRLCALALVAVDGALLDAGLDPRQPTFVGGETAVVFGTAYGCHATNEEYYKTFLTDGLQSASPRLFAYTLPSSPVGEITIHYGVTGPASALAQGLTAGLDALLDGMRQIERGRCQRSLIVAADVATPLLGRLLEDEGLSGPFFDGSAGVVVEPSSSAEARGRAPRGRVLGLASCFSSGQRATAIREATRLACQMAGASAESVEAIYGPTVDASAIGLNREQHDLAPSTLAAAPLHNLCHFLEHGRGRALIAIGDPEGTAAVALVERA